jgi:tetratricopeptide (TPR) repeat protein
LTTGSSNELMQEGIRHVREGHMAEAYQVFKQVIERDPRNEFAQIWISVTSENRAEKRAALEKALEINPDSPHAREALRALNAEESRLPLKPVQTTQATEPLRLPVVPPAGNAPTETPANPPAIEAKGLSNQPGRIGSQEFVSNPFQDMPAELAQKSAPDAEDRQNQPTRPYRVGQADNQTNPPRLGTRELNTTPRLEEKPLPASLVSAPGPKDKAPGKSKTAKGGVAAGAGVDPITAANQAANTPEKRERLFLRRIRITGLFILAIVVVLLGAFWVYNNLLQSQSKSLEASQTSTPVQAGATAAASPSGTPAANAVQTAPAAPSPTLIELSPAGTTNPTGSTPGATTAATLTSPAASSPAEIAKNLQTARDSQASGDYQGALTAYQAVLQADATNVPANLGLGTLYLSAPANALPAAANRYAEAAQAFKTVTARNPNWAGGYTHLGEALALQGNLKDAIEAYSRSLELDPNGPERWLALAALYDKDNQPEQARYCRERAGSVPPASPTPLPTATPAPTTPPGPTAAPPGTPK